MKRLRGFTLIEVLVALFIVAFGMGALLTAIASAADTSAYLREKSVAQWIALNRIAELRLQGNVQVGKTKSSSDVDFAGQKWRWRQEVSESGMANLLRIEVAVQNAAQKAPSDSAEIETDAIGLATGFFGRAVAKATGQVPPDWGSRGLAAQGTPGATGTPGALGTPGGTPQGVPPGPGAPPAPAATPSTPQG